MGEINDIRQGRVRGHEERQARLHASKPANWREERARLREATEERMLRMSAAELGHDSDADDAQPIPDAHPKPSSSVNALRTILVGQAMAVTIEPGDTREQIIAKQWRAADQRRYGAITGGTGTIDLT